MPPSSRLAVSNSSPLILYSSIGQLQLLQAIFAEILIPPAVWNEVVESGQDRPGAQSVRSADWIRLVNLSPLSPRPPLQSTRLDLGEYEAIMLALELGSDYTIILDDHRARRFATELGLAMIGSAGLLLRAKRRGFIPAIAPLLSQLESAGLYLSDALYQQLLVDANEGS